MWYFKQFSDKKFELHRPQTLKKIKHAVSGVNKRLTFFT